MGYHATADSAVVTPDRVFRKATEPLRPLNEAQGRYLAAIQKERLVLAIGPAGTGKSYIAAAFAAQELMSKHIDKIVITRPNVESGEKMGHLPGKLEEKYQPFLVPFVDALIERMGKSNFELALKRGDISPEPLGYMRGKTFNDAVVILDEAQNTTPEQMKMFLTRIGRNCTVVVDGDADQFDMKGESGLVDLLKRVKYIPSAKVVTFTEDDIVRDGVVKEVLQAYRKRC